MVAFILPFTVSKNQTRVFEPVPSLEKCLVNGLRVGNKAAIDQLYKMYSSSLMGIIIRIVKFDEIAEDVLQETFLKIWKSISLYDSSKGKLFTWMANLAKNTAIDQIRSKHYVNGIKTDDITDMQGDILDHHSYSQQNLDVIGLKQLTMNLSADQKAIIDLFYFEGYTHVEVAEKLNIPLGTVKTKIRRAISCLRRYFNETNQSLMMGA
jgi:RNA polymerase sigma factor (sigma-70 family)